MEVSSGTINKIGETCSLLWFVWGQIYTEFGYHSDPTLSQCTLAGPVYTGMPLVDPVYIGIPLATQPLLAWHTGTPLEKLSCKGHTLGCHWRNSNFCSLHWNTTGGTVTAHTRPAHVVKQSSNHASSKWPDGGTPMSKCTGLCEFSLYLEFTALQWIPVLLLTHMSTSTPLCACLWYVHHYSFLCIWGCKTNEIS